MVLLTLVASPRIVVGSGRRGEVARRSYRRPTDGGANRVVLVGRPRKRPTDTRIALDVELPHAVDGGLAASVEVGVAGEPDPGTEAVCPGESAKRCGSNGVLTSA